MKQLMILASLSVILLFGACEKDVINSATDEAETIDQIGAIDNLGLRNSHYKSMDELRDQLKTVIDDPSNHISAAWTLNENIGLIIGRDYAIINRINGQVTKGRLEDGGNFWNNAPAIMDNGEYCHPTKISQSHKSNGITAGWIYDDLIGFTSNNAFWNSNISKFQDADVWSNGSSNTGLLHHNEFWQNGGVGCHAITAGFKGPNNIFFAFSGSKIFAFSLESNQWILNKRIEDLQPNDPLHFVKHNNLVQLDEINAAFYNEGANEYVFMSELVWGAYNVSDNSWSYGSLY